MKLLLNALALCAATAYAAPKPAVFSTSTTSKEVCITKMRPGLQTPASIPTKTRTLVTKKRTTVTTTNSPTPSTVTVQPLGTLGLHVLAVDPASGSGTITVFTTVTASGNGSCASTTTVKANSTSTVYTGTYDKPAAKRTADASEVDSSDLTRRDNPMGDLLSNVFGELANALPSRVPFEVDCLDKVTTYLVATLTVSAPASTITVTASASSTAPVTSTSVSPSISSLPGTISTPPAANSSGTIYTTFTSTCTENGTSVLHTHSAVVSGSSVADAVSDSTVTVTSTVTAQPSSGSSSICTTASGATTTQHLKCAPTNLISEVHGYGIAQTEGHANETQGLAPGSDPSACCQLCMDTDNCAASQDDPKAGDCLLWYTSSPTCGLGFLYSNGTKELATGAGFLVQSSCGSIEAAPISVALT